MIASTSKRMESPKFRDFWAVNAEYYYLFEQTDLWSSVKAIKMKRK